MKRIYLDYNATSILDPKVIDWMQIFLHKSQAYNPSSIHADGRKARGILEKARLQVSKSLNINADKDDLHVIFTSSGTEANNLVIHNFKDAKFLVSSTEHVSILDVQHQDKEIISVDKNGLINFDHLAELLKSSTNKKLVSVMFANNETGVINNIKQISELVHKENAILHCDASQAYGKIKVNFHDLGCDLLTISSHKCGGPIGAAALIAKKKLGLKPHIMGGKQEQGLRAGTENLLAIGGFGVAAEYLEDKVMQLTEISQLRNYIEREILKFAEEAFIIGANVNRLPNTSSIRMPRVKSEEQLIRFDLAGISISAGSACSSGRIASSHVLKAMGITDNIANEIIRVSLGPTTTQEEIERFIALWKEIYKK